jgi:germination protein, Ger(x)C family
MNRIICALLASCLLLTGCVKQQILDRVNLFIVSAFDESNNGKIELMLAVPQYPTGKPGSVSNELLSLSGYTSSAIRELLSTQLDKPLNPGKLSVVLFSNDMALHGLKDELDVLYRNAYYSRKMLLAVVDGNSQQLLKAHFSSKEEKGMYLYTLLDTNIRKGILPGQNLHEFEYALAGKGLDPYLPLLKLQHDRVMISGTALFKDDQYELSINERQSQLMKLLMKDMKQGILEVKLDENTYLALENVGSKVKYRFTKNADKDTITIELAIKAKIRDAASLPVLENELERIKTDIENNIKESEMALIELFQKHELDPLGLGDFTRGHVRNWNEKDWKKVYPAMKIGLNVKVVLTETGIKN